MSPCVCFCHAHGKFTFLCTPTCTLTQYLTSFFPRNHSSLYLSLCLPDIQHNDVGPVPSFKRTRDPSCLA